MIIHLITQFSAIQTIWEQPLKPETQCQQTKIYIWPLNLISLDCKHIVEYDYVWLRRISTRIHVARKFWFGYGGLVAKGADPTEMWIKLRNMRQMKNLGRE